MLRPRTPEIQSFLETSEYRRFAEFCDACEEDKYPGLCLGSSGVGKSLAARHYAQWEYFNHLTNRQLEQLPIPDAQLVLGCDTVIYTPWVSMTANSVIVQLLSLIGIFEATMFNILKENGSPNPAPTEARVKLIIIDEAHRLKYQAIEHIRDLFDQLQVGIVLMGLHGWKNSLFGFRNFAIVLVSGTNSNRYPRKT